MKYFREYRILNNYLDINVTFACLKNSVKFFIKNMGAYNNSSRILYNSMYNNKFIICADASGRVPIQFSITHKSSI